jgi:hypothetical protein
MGPRSCHRIASVLEAAPMAGKQLGYGPRHGRDKLVELPEEAQERELREARREVDRLVERSKAPCEQSLSWPHTMRTTASRDDQKKIHLGGPCWLRFEIFWRAAGRSRQTLFRPKRPISLVFGQNTGIRNNPHRGMNMAQRGRKSALKLLDVVATETDVVPRPQAPAELSAEEAEEWIALVNAMPADYWPRVTHPNLVQLVRHIVSARRVSQMIERVVSGRKFKPVEYRRLLGMQRAETLAIINLLRSMRLTQLSIKPSSRTPIVANAMPRPWET